MPNYNLATPLEGNPNMTAFVQVFREELARIDLTKLMIFLFATTDARLLPYLAEQFDMLGYNGWFLADTEQKKRDLLLSAAEIKKYAGTPYAIKRAAQALGIKGNISITEGIGSTYDGSSHYDGSLNYGGGNWAKFTVTFSAADNPGLTPGQIDNFKKMVETFKPARSVLVGINVV